MKEKVDKVALYIITEKTINYIFNNELNINDNVKSTLYKLICNSFINFSNMLYQILKYYFIPTIKDSNNYINITNKDLYKVSVISKFVDEEDIFVIDIFDYLYAHNNIDNNSFSVYLYDYIGYKMDELNIPYEEAYDYLYYIENIFNIFILNTIFDKIHFEVEENIVLGLQNYNNQELRIFVYRN